MLQPCQDNYSTTFASYEGMRRYHEKESLESRWHRCRVNELHIEPLDKASPLMELRPHSLRESALSPLRTRRKTSVLPCG